MPIVTARKLTPNQRGALLNILNHHICPNACRFSENDTFTTRGGNLGCWKFDRRSREGLFDQGLLEAVRVEGYTYGCGTSAAGIMRVTAKGQAALETGKYEPVESAKAPSRKPADFVPVRSPFADLPKIIVVEGIEDGGEGAYCPHCGAEGRWIVRFTLEGGAHAGAMRGCFKLWPKHQFAEIAERLLDKEREYAERSKKSGREWRLSSWDVEILDAIRGFAHGRLSELEASQRIRAAQERAKSYRRGRKRAAC